MPPYDQHGSPAAAVLRVRGADARSSGRRLPRAGSQQHRPYPWMRTSPSCRLRAFPSSPYRRTSARTLPAPTHRATADAAQLERWRARYGNPWWGVPAGRAERSRRRGLRSAQRRAAVRSGIVRGDVGTDAAERRGDADGLRRTAHAVGRLARAVRVGARVRRHREPDREGRGHEGRASRQRRSPLRGLRTAEMRACAAAWRDAAQAAAGRPVREGRARARGTGGEGAGGAGCAQGRSAGQTLRARRGWPLMCGNSPPASRTRLAATMPCCSRCA